MKAIQCAYPPHHHNVFVATCRLWAASGGVHALLVLLIHDNWFMTLRVLNKHKAKSIIMHKLRHWPSIAGMSPQSHVVMRRMGALDCLHDVTIYLYYALCFMLVEQSVCHEPISVLINVFMLLA